MKQELTDVIVEGSEERYQFTWPEKKKARLLANTPIRATLRPCKDESVDFDTTQNLYIEGDNLDVLKLLRETYLGKIKMIYIDPPYNTGSDFIYNDNFTMSTEEYMETSRNYDIQGNRLTQNMESNGRYHTNWLNMIYPRIKIARDLLSEDGVIFISIDDNELYNCKKVCDEAFGDRNFICNIVRRNKAGSGHDSKKLAVEFDYILCYAKRYESNNVNMQVVNVDEDPKYKLQDEHFERGKYYLRDLDYRGSYSEKLDYAIKTPDGTEIYPGGMFGKPNTWRWSKDKFEWGLKNDYIVFKRSNAGWKIYIKQYQFVDNECNPYDRKIPYRALIDYSNGIGSMEFNEIMETNVFSFPKPVDLIEHLLQIASQKDSIVMDFFSGSASTAQAVMQLNMKDGGNRKFIMVQVSEKCSEDTEAYKAGYKNICEIGKERIRRAGKKIKDDAGIMAQNLDTGFRVLKLDSSNMKDVYYSPDQTSQQSIEDMLSNVKEDRTPMDLLFQVMLETDVLLSSKIEEKEIEGKKVFIVNDNDLICCFDSDIGDDVVKAIAQMKPLYAVFRDSSFSSDSPMVNAEQYFRTYSPDTQCRII